MIARHIQPLAPLGGTTGSVWTRPPGPEVKLRPANSQPHHQPPTRHRGAQAVTSAATGQAPKLLDQMSNVLRTNHYSIRTEKAYIDWIYRFILFHGKRHPRKMGVAEIGQFLTHLAQAKHVAPSTQNQALCAILFLYKRVLNIELGEVQFPWAKRPEYLPVILSLEEVRKIIGHLTGTYALLAKRIQSVRSPADMFGKNGFMKPNIALAELPPALEKRFREVVANQYQGDMQVALAEFLDLHDKHGASANQ